MDMLCFITVFKLLLCINAYMHQNNAQHMHMYAAQPTSVSNIPSEVYVRFTCTCTGHRILILINYLKQKWYRFKIHYLD